MSPTDKDAMLMICGRGVVVSIDSDHTFTLEVDGTPVTVTSTEPLPSLQLDQKITIAAPNMSAAINVGKVRTWQSD